MRGKPNFMKKTYNQTVNAKDPITANNIQKGVDFKADNKTISDMAGKAMSSSSNSNNFNCKGYLSTPLEGVSKSGRFSVLDPLALLDESDLNFPEMYRIALNSFIQFFSPFKETRLFDFLVLLTRTPPYLI